ncbi:MAG: hypothetical protein ACOYKJ_08935 [Candidatus Howiella sp.]|jgi:hypothetical protein
MSNFFVPTSKDIYLEADGARLGTVESYKCYAARKSRSIEAFGEEEPVAAVTGRTSYTLELSRVDTSPAYSDGVDFYTLEDFNLVVVKPDCRVVYTGCRWSDIQESAEVGAAVIERVKLVAAKRMVLQ